MKNKYTKVLSRSNIVGVIASKAELDYALRHPKAADVFEWRVDCLNTPAAVRKIEKLRKPLIVTVRDPSEGGMSDWSRENRAALLQAYLPLATFIDVEFANVVHYNSIVAHAKEAGVGVIVSSHDFDDSMVQNVRVIQFRDKINYHDPMLAGFDVFKFALDVGSSEHFSEFIKMQRSLSLTTQVKIVMMAMGKYGKISRLLAGLHKSVFIYGHLGNPRVKGQLHATKLRELIKQVT